MTGDRVLEYFLFLLPAVVAGMIAYYFFRLHTKNEDGRRRFLLQKDAQKHAMPIRLQAYERMALFLERIVPSNLLIRVSPTSSDVVQYETLLIKTIENEFEHNVSQQIYMSDECWNIIKAAKNASIQLIRKAAMSNKVDSADKLRETILNDMLDKQAPSAAALSFVKKEVSELW